MAKLTESTQLTPVDAWVKRLSFVAFGFLYSTHMVHGRWLSLTIPIQQGRLWSSFASMVFLGLIIGRKFSKLRQSAAFYSAQRTIFGAKAI
jgi:hypothetical protein